MRHIWRRNKTTNFLSERCFKRTRRKSINRYSCVSPLWHHRQKISARKISGVQQYAPRAADQVAYMCDGTRFTHKFWGIDGTTQQRRPVFDRTHGLRDIRLWRSYGRQGRVAQCAKFPLVDDELARPSASLVTIYLHIQCRTHIYCVISTIFM